MTMTNYKIRMSELLKRGYTSEEAQNYIMDEDMYAYENRNAEFEYFDSLD